MKEGTYIVTEYLRIVADGQPREIRQFSPIVQASADEPAPDLESEFHGSMMFQSAPGAPAFPVEFSIDAKNLAEAFAGFESAAKTAAENLAAEISRQRNKIQAISALHMSDLQKSPGNNGKHARRF